MLKRFALAVAMAALMSPALAEEPAAAKSEDTTPPAAAEGAAAPAAETETAAAEPEGPIGDGEPRALIMDISGFSDPAISAFDELNDGASVKLDETAELAMTFYPTCEDMTIRGGTVSIENARLSIKDGEILSKAKGECPGHVKLSPADIVNASIVTRAVKARPWINPEPLMIGLVGVGAKRYDHIVVTSKEDGPIIDAALDGRSVVWPEGVGPLKIGQIYVVVLTGEDTQMFAARVTPDEKAPRVTVFRLN